jgi:hypothetical protein
MKKVMTFAGLVLAGAAIDARADVITDWNARACDVLIEAKLGTPPAVRAMAIVQTAVHGAVDAAHGASVDAAVAAANRTVLMKLVPAQQASIDTAYKAALATIEEGAAKDRGIAIGEQAATAVLARRADDKVASSDDYRPHTAAGAYVPTVMPAAPQWSARKPWLMSSAGQFRPGPPPALTSEAWTRDFNEVKDLGSRNSTRRSVEQSEIARFWEYSLPPIYYGVVRSVADTPGRDVARNARLFAAVSQAMDDALIGIFDAKYHYGFWRPVTAIRNGDIDGNEATQRDASWTPLIDNPMHPEFPSGHSVLASSVGAVLKAEVGAGPFPMLTTTSPTAKGTARRWTSPDDFVREVSDSRIYAGIHYRSATDAGAAMGMKIGELAASRHLRADAPHSTTIGLLGGP